MGVSPRLNAHPIFVWMHRELIVQRINQTERAATIVTGSGRLGDKVTEGLSIVVFVASNGITKKAVNMALFLARYSHPFVMAMTR